ncbi:DUF624 domain-containing protein [Paenibacillus sp.]|uniref:YesL family protein n=1 Tax=Paenibacillus sp. TaxID=58172 RepID=UPI0028124E88|nr:DUF624 domain-containing protein [Paenibacillus sp.]
MEFRGLMGGFYRISEWIMRLSVTNVLWIVTAFPVFFFVLNLFVATDEQQVQAFLLAIAVLAPFTLFPSTSAMFALARKWVTGDGDVPLLKTFFRSYKENYLQSMIGGLFFMVLLTVLFFNFRFYAGQTGYTGLLAYLFIALTVMAFLAVFNFFCIIVHLHMKTLQLIKNALLITIGQPVRTILIGVSNVVVLYISIFQFTFLLPFFTGSLIAIVTFWHFHNGFRKIMTKQEELEAKRAEQAEQAAAEADAEDGQASR